MGADRDGQAKDLDLTELPSIPIGGALRAIQKSQRDPLVTGAVVYIVFIWIFCYWQLLLRPTSMFTINDALNTNLALECIAPEQIHFCKNFHGIANWGDFWLWVDTVLKVKVYTSTYYPGGTSYIAHKGNNNDRRIASMNRLITPIRFRQARQKENENCRSAEKNHAYSRPCWGEFGTKYESQGQTTNEWKNSPHSEFKSGMSDLVGNSIFTDGHDYGTSGHIVDVDLDRNGAETKLKSMVESRWTDEGTRAIAVDINTYNPNLDMVTVSRLSIDISDGGKFYPRVRILSARLNPYSSFEDKFIRLFLELLWGCMLLRYMLIECQELWQEGPYRYFTQMWNLIELGNIVLFVFIIVRWVQYLSLKKDLLRTRVWRGDETFQELFPVAEKFNESTVLCSLNVLWSSMRIFKFLQLNPRFLLIRDVLVHAMIYVLPFTFITILIMVAFCFSGHVLYGVRMEKFHSLWDSGINILLSSWGGLRWRRLKTVHSENTLVAPSDIWNVWWMFMSFTLMNMFIAILCESYVYVREQTNKRLSIEADHPLPSWALYFRSKLTCIKPKSLQLTEQIMDMKQQAKELVEALDSVPGDQLDALLQKKVMLDEGYLTVEDVAPFFMDSDEEGEAMRRATEWLENFAKVAVLSTVAPPHEQTMAEKRREHIADLRQKIYGLEAELFSTSRLLKQALEMRAQAQPYTLFRPKPIEVWMDVPNSLQQVDTALGEDHQLELEG